MLKVLKINDFCFRYDAIIVAKITQIVKGFAKIFYKEVSPMRTASSLSPTVHRILSIDPLARILDPVILTILLYTSLPADLVRVLFAATPKSTLCYAATLAMEMHLNPERLEEMLQSDVFSRATRKLLDVIDEDRDLGARLMPHLAVLSCCYEEFGIPDPLYEQLSYTMEHLRTSYGFAIVEIRDGEPIVIPADDVIPA